MQLVDGRIQVAYRALVQLMRELKVAFPSAYKTGNLSMGYLDYTYFPFFNSYLREHKLRFGLVLNHEKLRIELWLMGQNAQVQKEYWQMLKGTQWNQGVETMPQYSALEVALEDRLDFEKKQEMIEQILAYALKTASEIENYLQSEQK